MEELSGQTCQICGDEIELTVDGESFVACNECAFPVCRPCYEYERREGNQSCPQCKTRYKRIKGDTLIVSIGFKLWLILNLWVNIVKVCLCLTKVSNCFQEVQGLKEMRRMMGLMILILSLIIGVVLNLKLSLAATRSLIWLLLNLALRFLC